jgi:hypothetical protein
LEHTFISRSTCGRFHWYIGDLFGLRDISSSRNRHFVGGTGAIDLGDGNDSSHALTNLGNDRFDDGDHVCSRIGVGIADFELGLIHKVRVDLLEARGTIDQTLTSTGLAQEGVRGGGVLQQGTERRNAARAHLGLGDDALLNGAGERAGELDQSTHHGIGSGLHLEAFSFGDERAFGGGGHECHQGGVDGLGGGRELLQCRAVFVDGSGGLRQEIRQGRHRRQSGGGGGDHVLQQRLVGELESQVARQ